MTIPENVWNCMNESQRNKWIDVELITAENVQKKTEFNNKLLDATKEEKDYFERIKKLEDNTEKIQKDVARTLIAMNAKMNEKETSRNWLGAMVRKKLLCCSEL